MLVGTLAASILGKPFVWHLRDLMSKAHFNRVHRCLAIGAANVSTTSVIANSFATKQAFVESGGRESKVTVIYNGIESEPFNGSDSASSRRIREQLGLQDASIVGAFSRLAPWKGQHTLIQALETIPNAHVLLVGDALFESDRSYVEHLHALTKNLQMQDRVHFLGFREDIADVMQACDIVAHTSVSPEPFGRVIVEGMLSARPVIATNAGGAAEIIQDGETGLLVAPGESLTLANAIREILEDPSKSEKLSRNGRQYALRRFTLDTMLSGITKHLEQLF
jgi:glycosyltransferase involved in cell wall biosynthesis